MIAFEWLGGLSSKLERKKAKNRFILSTPISMNSFVTTKTDTNQCVVDVLPRVAILEPKSSGTQPSRRSNAMVVTGFA